MFEPTYEDFCAKYKDSKITMIEFFPDYCSSGIWVTLDNTKGHANWDMEDLTNIFGLKFSDDFIHYNKLMNQLFDMMPDTFGNIFEYKLDTGNLFYVLPMHLYKLFSEENPEYAHLLDYRVVNHYLIGNHSPEKNEFK